MGDIIKNAPERRMLRRPQVEAKVGLQRSTIYQYILEGRFPAPIHLGNRAVGWDSIAIDEWIKERIDQSNSDRQMAEIVSDKAKSQSLSKMAPKKSAS